MEAVICCIARTAPRHRPGHCLAAQNRPSSTWPCACPWRDQTREAFVFSVWQNAGAYHCELLSPRPIAHRRRRLLRPAAAGLNRRGSLGLPRNKRQFYARSVVVLHSKRWYVPPSAPAAQWPVPAPTPNSTRHQSAQSRFPAVSCRCAPGRQACGPSDPNRPVQPTATPHPAPPLQPARANHSSTLKRSPRMSVHWGCT